MSEHEFATRWAEETSQYAAWGSYITKHIMETLDQRIKSEHATFLKIPPQPRLKKLESLIDKAFHRGKNYTDPYVQITDKVGVRFVVLLVNDIKFIEGILAEWKDIAYSKDRDYEKERLENPLEFTYQSVHYVVRAARAIEHDGVEIAEGTPCEIQIRTLLQHAHSELTHDSIYKPTAAVKADPSVLRVVARSMALIEATDECFDTVVEKLAEMERPFRESLHVLGRLYHEYLHRPAELERSNTLILEAYSELLSDNLETQMRDFIERKPYIVAKISQHAESSHLFRQASTLLVYMAANAKPHTTKDRWPFTPDDLTLIYSDLGINFDGY
ncbi:MAG: GTP pyrophosphokinase [Pseudomonas sp.]